ncbi:MAG: 2-oxo acid dehydrogenase subunit E2 [Chloroflexota bacterium]|nr:MAG: 2-oxo acid dehydrogenase subunit E2 [Chloroflexota bacterium]
MTYEFKLADLGEGMHEAEIVQWLIDVGDTAKLDQAIAKVETDKAVVELPSPVTGRVSEIRVKDGQTAKVGDVLVVFETSAASGGDGTPKSSETSAAATSSAPTNMSSVATSSSQSAPSVAARPRVQAAPAVRKLAFELGVDLEQVTPSSASGRVSLEDVRAYAERAGSATSGAQNGASTAEVASTAAPKEEQLAPSTSPVEKKVDQAGTEDQRQPLTGLRKRVAEHMERSWRTIPHATAFDEIDGGALIALRQALKPIAEQRGVRLTYMPLLIKLLIPLLKEFPIFNASLDEEKREIVYKRSYHIGVATDSPEGLLVPVMRNADRLTLMEVAAKLEKLIEGAQKRTLALPEVSGSTFTLNNVGSFGGGSGTPIINYPEAAILAVGRIQEKAIARQGAVIVRPVMPLALSFDHRLIDGAMSGKFLGRLKELVENPQQLMLDMV